jgi:hypothetical protein
MRHPAVKNYPAPNVNSTEAERLCPISRLLKTYLIYSLKNPERIKLCPINHAPQQS